MAIFEKQINPIDFESDVAVGINLPMTNSNSNLFNQTYLTFNQLKANLKNLILTEPGERFMLPDFGCGLRKKLFEQNVNKLLSDIQNLIMIAVDKWLPTIKINKIDIQVIDQEQHELFIHIDFSTIYDITQKDQLSVLISK